MGWRYQYILIGGICLCLAIIRVFFMRMEESCKWLVAQGRFGQALEELHKVATMNGSEIDITIDSFEPLEESRKVPESDKKAISILWGQIRGLFEGRRLAISTTGLILLWMCIGIA